MTYNGWYAIKTNQTKLINILRIGNDLNQETDLER